MLYQFISLPDETEISYSEVKKDKLGHDTVRIYIEKWDEQRNDFDCVEFYLPKFNITKNKGFSDAIIKEHMKHIHNLQDVIWECALEKRCSINA